MCQIRFTISRLLGLILVLGLVLAGLRSGSNAWFKSIYSLTFIILICAAIAARRRGAFWHGFAVAGWLYFVIGFGPWIGSPSPGTVNRNLVTSMITDVVTDAFSQPDSEGGGRSGPFVLMIVDGNRANRDGIVHCALTILFGCVGGLAARRLARNA